MLFILGFNYLQAQTAIDTNVSFSSISTFKLADVKQQKNVRANINDKPLSLFIFLSPECPLCQNYTKTVNEVYNKYQQKVNVYGIVPGNAYTAREVTDFGKKYKVAFRLLIDAQQELTHYLKATVTPQAILVNNKGNLVYTGAIDDWVQALGKKRLKVSQHYVEDAIEQSLQFAEVKIKRKNAIGCKINDY